MNSKWWRLVVIALLLFCAQVNLFPAKVSGTTPSATVSVVPSVQTLSPGGSFDVTIQLNINFQSRGFQCVLNWDPTKVQCSSVELGGFYKDFGEAHNAVVMSDPRPLTYDNNNGRFPSQGWAQIWMEGGDFEIIDNINSGKRLGPTGSGNLFVLHMTAKSGASGTVTFTLSDVIVNDNETNANEITPTINNGQVTISTAASTPAPTVSDFSPASGGQGATVVITGTGFKGNSGENLVTDVKFGGVSAQSFTVDSASQITAVVGSGASGRVSVTTAGGTAESSSDFTYIAAPVIYGFSPASGRQGTEVTVTGANLSGATRVTFGGVPATIKSLTDTSIVAIVGNGASGEVSVTTPGGTHSVPGFTFIPEASATPTPTGTTAAAPTTSSPTPTSSGSVPTTAPAPEPATRPAPRQTSSSKAKTVATSPASKLVSTSSLLTLDLSEVIDSGGRLQETIQQNNISYNGIRLLSGIEIKSGTRMLDKDGEPLSTITVQPAAVLPPLPSRAIIIGHPLEFGPSGATFSKPLTVIYEYTAGMLPEGVRENDLYFACYDTVSGNWVKCEYTLDTASNRITANISHFSIFAVIAPGGTGMGWSLAGAVIIAELAVAAVIIYVILRRKRRPLEVTVSSSGRETRDVVMASTDERSEGKLPAKSGSSIDWDEFLRENSLRKKKPFKTNLRIAGGRITIPREGESSDIELISTPNSQIEVSLEYDPELYPQGIAKIIVPGSVPEHEKSKEAKK